MSESYAALLRLAPARRLVYALAAAGLSFGMLSLTVLLTVERATGSYPAGGFAVAAFALLAASRRRFAAGWSTARGARLWLPLLASGYAVFLVALDLAAARATLPPGRSIAARRRGSGLSAPPLFASARSLWVHVVEPDARPPRVRRDVAALRRGPDHRAGARRLAVPLRRLDRRRSSAARSLVCGACSRCRRPARRSPDVAAAADADAPREPRRSPGCSASRSLFGGALGLVQVAVPTLAAPLGQASLAGLLLAAFAVGSVARRALVRRPRLARLGARPLPARRAASLGVLLAPAALADGARPRSRRSCSSPGSPSARRPSRCSRRSTCSRRAAAPSR